MIGQKVAHYHIVEELGGGAMGVVYRAEDSRLERTVALKFLPPDLTRDPGAKDRFLREARAASRLDHPNICTIHEIRETDDGRLYIVMGCYEGETLRQRIDRGPLPIDEAVAVAAQVARGLAQAHAHGIVHRDVKPANVLLVDRGRDRFPQVKILDFGLAKVAGDASLTRSGSSLGTPMYMAPEQVKGDVDARSDLWSLGVVLYEMLAGERPFHGNYSPAVIFSILHRAPTPLDALRPDVPAWLSQLVGRLLVKDPDQRIGSADEVLQHLEPAAGPAAAATSSSGTGSLTRSASASATAWEVPAPAPARAGRLAVLAVALVTAALAGWLWLHQEGSATTPPPARAAPPTIAVLPFDDLSPEPGPAFFADGMTEALITDLAKVSGLRVISRASAMRYKGSAKTLSQIAGELGVGYLLQGSVVKAGDEVRISSQLVDAGLDQVLWSESYERPLRGILALQREVARAVVEQIEVRLTPREESALAATAAVDPRVVDLYLRGRAAWNERTVAAIRRGIELFERALELDATFALAEVGLAESYQVLGSSPFFDLPPRVANDLARTHAERALELDPTLGEAYAAMAMADAHRWDWRGSEEKFRRALELSPSYATAYQWYGETLMLQQRWDEARQAFFKAQLLDPLSPVIRGQVGRLLINRRRYADAVEYFRGLIAQEPDFWLNYYGLAASYLGLGREEEALAAIGQAGELSGGSVVAEVVAATIRASAGDREPAAALIATLDSTPGPALTPMLVAGLAAALGDRERALTEIERGLEVGDPSLPFIDLDPWYDPLRDEPRFRRVLEEIGLRE